MMMIRDVDDGDERWQKYKRYERGKKKGERWGMKDGRWEIKYERWK